MHDYWIGTAREPIYYTGKDCATKIGRTPLAAAASSPAPRRPRSRARRRGAAARPCVCICVRRPPRRRRLGSSASRRASSHSAVATTAREAVGSCSRRCRRRAARRSRASSSSGGALADMHMQALVGLQPSEKSAPADRPDGGDSAAASSSQGQAPSSAIYLFSVGAGVRRHRAGPAARDHAHSKTNTRANFKTPAASASSSEHLGGGRAPPSCRGT